MTTNLKTDTDTLWGLLDEVPDPRDPSGKRYNLAAILRMMLCGFLSGCNTTTEVIRWSKRLTKKQKGNLGLHKGIPCDATLSNLFRQMDVSAIAKVLNKWQLKKTEKPKALLHIAMDGKTLRASAYKEQPAAHVLSLFATGLKSTLHQYRQKDGENEISTAIRLLQDTELKGVVVTGDAIFAQKKYMQGNN